MTNLLSKNNDLISGDYSAKEWNKLVPFIKTNFIDISEPLPTQTAYIFMGSFHGILFNPITHKFFDINGSVNNIKIKEVSNIPIKKVFGW